MKKFILFRLLSSSPELAIQRCTTAKAKMKLAMFLTTPISTVAYC
jgi:hypothetical protein